MTAINDVHDNVFEEEGALDDLPVMTKAELQEVAIAHGGYSTPSLNDILYLHFKGYRSIENLEEFTGLKALWLNSNGFGKIENLSHLHELRCLFLQSNALTKIENLHGLHSLIQLDLSENNIRCVEGISQLSNLTTLNLSKNALKDADSVCHLKECNELTAVDLSKNQLNGGDDIIDCLSGIAKVTSLNMAGNPVVYDWGGLSGIAKVTSLNMAGNPVVSKVASFRKKMIVACKALRYLDRPVFDVDRATAEAWASGGIDAEKKTKIELQQAKRDKERKAIEEFRAWQESVRSTREIVSARYEVDGAAATPAVVLESGNETIAEDSGSVVFDDNNCQAETAEDRPFIELLEEEPATKPDLIPIADETKVQASKKVSFADINMGIPAKGKDTAQPTKPVLQPKVMEVTAKEALGEQNQEKENIKPASSPPVEVTHCNDEIEMETIEAASRRIRDSIAILKGAKQQKKDNQMLSGITMGWTKAMEHDLMKLAVKYNHDFDMVASKMGKDHSSQFIMFDTESCYRRYTLLDLSSDGNIMEEGVKFPITEKPLSYFIAGGQRKSIEEIRLDDDKVNARLFSPESFPNMDNMSEEGNAIMHRSELWDELESST
ncbi:hypothetical protein ACHAXR_012368 [Thalassiosira sp. AJA248-18]